MNKIFRKVNQKIGLLWGEEMLKFINGGVILILSSFATGVLNYLYHLLMGRLLGPNDYGILSSLISLLYIFSVPMGTFSLVVTRFAADQTKNKEFFQKTKGKVELFSLFWFLLLIAFTPIIATFLHLKFLFPIILINLSLAISFLNVFGRAILQGLLQFTFLALSGIWETGLKLVLAFFLVYYLNWQIIGAVSSLVIATTLGYFLIKYFLKKEFSSEVSQNTTVFSPGLMASSLSPQVVSTASSLLNRQGHSKGKISKELWDFILPVFFFTLSFTLLYNIDIVLARHFLSFQEAGWYGALSTIGRIIYFLVGPLASVFFPMAVKKKIRGQTSNQLFIFSLSLTFIIAFVITLFYFLFPNLIMKVFYGAKFLPAAGYLGFFGLFLSFYSLAYFLGSFFLSQGIYQIVVVFPLMVVFLQVILIVIFHHNIFQILAVSVFACGLLFLLFLLYYFLRITSSPPVEGRKLLGGSASFLPHSSPPQDRRDILRRKIKRQLFFKK